MRRNRRADAGRKRRRELERLEERWAFNVAPTGIQLDPGSVPENSGPLSFVGELHVNDPDVGDAHRFILLDSAGGRFTLDGAKVLVASGPQLDFETVPSHTITVRAIDSGGLSLDVSLPIAVTDVSEPPTDIALTSAAIAEDSPAGAVVGQLSTSDPDLGDTFAYSLLDSAGGRFAIQFDRVVVAANATLDYESTQSHVIRVKTTDGSGLSYERDLTIAVGNVNEAPSNLALSGLTLPENSPGGTVVGRLSATDVDFNAAGLVVLYDPADGSAHLANLGPDTITLDAYQLESAAGKLDPQGWRSIADWVAQGPEALASALAVLGPGGDAAATGWEEAGVYPTFLGEFNFAGAAELSPSESLSLGKPVAPGAEHDFTLTYSALHGPTGIRRGAVREGAPLAFSLVDSSGGRFEIVGNQLRTVAGFEWDFESFARYSIRVRVTDQGGLGAEQAFGVELTNVNEPPSAYVPAQATVAVGQMTVLPGVSIGDSDVSTEAGFQAAYRVALAVDHGQVSLGSLVDLQVISGANHSPAVTVEGPFAKVNAALATLSYQPPADFVGDAKLSVAVDDKGFLGAGSPLSHTAILPIIVRNPPTAVADHYQVAAGGELRRQSYARAVLADAPLAFWRLGEATVDETARDATGNNYDGTYQGNVQLGKPAAFAGESDASAEFSGDRQAIGVPFMGEVQTRTKSFSVEAWIRPEQYVDFQRVLSAEWNVNGGWGFGMAGERLVFTTFGIKDYMIPQQRITLRQWTHVAAVFDAQFDVSFYVNGELAGKVEGTQGPGPTRDVVGLGANPSGGQEYWHGGLDEVAYYARELTPAEIARHYQSAQANLTVLANDFAADGDQLTATLAEGPQHGQLTFAADGSFVYTPEAGFVGQDAFSYRASDGSFTSGPTLVTITVPPAAVAAALGGDVNGDEVVDLTDFALLKAHFATGTTRATGDLNGNGQVDLSDFGLLKINFGVRGAAIDDDVLLALAMEQATRLVRNA